MTTIQGLIPRLVWTGDFFELDIMLSRHLLIEPPGILGCPGRNGHHIVLQVIPSLLLEGHVSLKSQDL